MKSKEVDLPSIRFVKSAKFGKIQTLGRLNLTFINILTAPILARSYMVRAREINLN